MCSVGLCNIAEGLIALKWREAGGHTHVPSGGGGQTSLSRTALFHIAAAAATADKLYAGCAGRGQVVADINCCRSN